MIKPIIFKNQGTEPLNYQTKLISLALAPCKEAQEAPVPRRQVPALAACLEAAEIAILVRSHEGRYK